MSTWGNLFLGLIAVATLLTAIVQIAVLLAAAKLARRLDTLADSVEEQMKPLFAHLDAIGREAVRATSLAGAQVERVDALFSDGVTRLEQTLHAIRSAVSLPAREGAALLAGFRAILGALGDARGPKARGRAEDEDTLFI